MAIRRLLQASTPLQANWRSSKWSTTPPTNGVMIAQDRMLRSPLLANRRQYTETRNVNGELSVQRGGLPRGAEVGSKRFGDFDLAGKVFVVTGGARGLGLALAEALIEAGGRG